MRKRPPVVQRGELACVRPALAWSCARGGNAWSWAKQRREGSWSIAVGAEKMKQPQDKLLYVRGKEKRVSGTDSITHCPSAGKGGFRLTGTVSKAEITQQGSKIRKIWDTAGKLKWVQVVYTRGDNENINPGVPGIAEDPVEPFCTRLVQLRWGPVTGCQLLQEHGQGRDEEGPNLLLLELMSGGQTVGLRRWKNPGGIKQKQELRMQLRETRVVLPLPDLWSLTLC